MPTKKPTAPLTMSNDTTVRVEALLEQVERLYDANRIPPDLTFFDEVARVMKARHGYVTNRWTLGPLLTDAKGERRLQLLSVVSHVLKLGPPGNPYFRQADVINDVQFEAFLNVLLEQDGQPQRLENQEWCTARETEADELLRVLLNDAGDDVVPCKQGDIQQEVVASSVQSRLSRPGSVLVDYGAGLGRVGEAVSAAKLFGAAKYIAVEMSISEKLHDVVAKLGPNASAIERAAFLDGEQQADVIMVVNVLHHIPFQDLGRDFARVLGRLRADGVLLVHEMGALKEPEQRNVPWYLEDIECLFGGVDCLHVNAPEPVNVDETPAA